MSQAVNMSWYHNSDQLEHEYDITAWALLLVPEICHDVLGLVIGGKNLVSDYQASYSTLSEHQGFQ